MAGEVGEGWREVFVLERPRGMEEKEEDVVVAVELVRGGGVFVLRSGGEGGGYGEVFISWRNTGGSFVWVSLQVSLFGLVWKCLVKGCIWSQYIA